MPVPKVSGLNCPNCGGPIELRSFTNALSVVCPQCLSVLDAKDPNLRILQQAAAKQTVQPLIPLGARGKLDGGTFEAIGFQVRTVQEDGEAFSWSEYLLFNPYKGFRYLTEYQGHWNDVRTLNTLPAPSGNDRVNAGGSDFRLFSNSLAATTFVLGEFPWQVRVGETIQVTDYVTAPRILSAESTPEEVVWSMGDYMTGEQVWQAFQLPATPPRAYGIFANQPSPYEGKVSGIWGASLKMMGAAALVALLLYAVGARRVVYKQSFHSASGASPVFEIPGHTSNLELKTTNHTGFPIYVHFALAGQNNTRLISFARQIRTGSEADSAVISAVEPGRYTLRADADALNGPVDGAFEVELRRDVPTLGWLVGALLLLLIPPIIQSWRKMAFERSRWSQAG